MYLSIWCKECQHTLSADPKKVLTCPKCGSAHLGAAVPTSHSYEMKTGTAERDVENAPKCEGHLNRIRKWLNGHYGGDYR